MAEEREYREISEEELYRILDEHKKWLETGGKEGARAGLSRVKWPEGIYANIDLREAVMLWTCMRNIEYDGVDLQKAQLHGADLEGANLFDAKLQEARLTDANLRKAVLVEAKLHKADLSRANMEGANIEGGILHETELRDANLKGANLRNADLTGAKSLLASQLAGLDLTGAKMPADLHDFAGPLRVVEEASRNARNLFYVVILACVYALITVATTTDLSLILNDKASPLPIIKTEMPIVYFYIATPILLLAVYIYFHMYIIRLFENMAKLPAIFPDGRPLHEKAYPWLLGGLVCAHFDKLKKNRPSLSKLQVFLSVVLGWYFLPFTLLVVWLRYLPTHNWYGTVFLGLIVVAAVGLSLVFYRISEDTLQGRDATKLLSTTGDLFGMTSYAKVLLLYGVLIFSLLLYVRIMGGSPESEASGYVNANLLEEELSVKPDKWTGEDISEYKFVKGARLKKVNLENAIANHAFLAKADLDEANLTGIKLVGADLIQAKLNDAQLEKANLSFANLSGAEVNSANLVRGDFTMANFRGAKLNHADLRFANFTSTDLRSAKLEEADLRDAHFIEADLSYANLFIAKLDRADLGNAKLIGTQLISANLTGANLRVANLTRANLLCAILKGDDISFANLSGADLRKATLIDATLRVANLRGADLSGADLMNADLSGANLRGVNLSAAHLEFATIYDADLSFANFSGAYFKNARINGANFSEVNLSGADLRCAKLIETDLSDADFSGADLRGADLRFANFIGANLSTVTFGDYSSGIGKSKTDLSFANLSGVRYLDPEELKKAIGNSKTKLPVGYSPPDDWK